MTTLNNTTPTIAEEKKVIDLLYDADCVLEDYAPERPGADSRVIDIIKFYRKNLEKARQENDKLKEELKNKKWIQEAKDEWHRGYDEGYKMMREYSLEVNDKLKKENEGLKKARQAQFWINSDKNDSIYKFKKKEYDNNVKIASWLIALDMAKNQDYCHEGNDAITVRQLWKCVKDFGVDENNPNIKPEHYRNWSEFPENGIDN